MHGNDACCDACSARGRRHDLTAVDRSGGSAVSLCDPCVGYLLRAGERAVEGQCAFCFGPAAGGRADAVIDCRTPHKIDASICDDCRRRLLTKGNAPRDRAPDRVSRGEPA